MFLIIENAVNELGVSKLTTGRRETTKTNK